MNAVRGPVKCRIPQKVPTARQKPPTKPKVPVNSKSQVVSAQQPRYPSRSTSRSRSGEQTRPQSANRMNDTSPGKLSFSSRPVKQDKDRFPSLRIQKPSTIPKRVSNDPVIVVPVTQKQQSKTLYTNRTMTFLPDQETINRNEDLELQQGVLSPDADLNERESITSRTDMVMQLKQTWQEKLLEFERMKQELNIKQSQIMEVYVTLGVTHQRMSALGQRASLPPADELRIMNVANLTPDQLLQLCSNALYANDKQLEDLSSKIPVALDMNKLYNMPSKLVGTCEHTLVKRKEIIETLEYISKKKDINVSELLRKIKEFNSENEMLACTLEKVKNEFMKELKEIVEFISKSVNDTMVAQLRNEQLTCEMSELNSENNDLRRQLHNTDHYKSSVHKGKLEINFTIQELEKQLKEEKCKRTLLKDRLTRAEGQVKISTEQTSQLEAALEQARSKTWHLERTVQQLNEQNQKLQDDFDKELNKFTESIRENTSRLEEIADAREKLQAEKEELEKRLVELSVNYTESLDHVKQEMNKNVMKLVEIEKSYENEKEEKHVLENKVESLCSQLLSSELRYKDIRKELQDRDAQLSKTTEYYKELEIVKEELYAANAELSGYRKRLADQNEAVKEIESNFKEAVKLGEDLRSNLRNKEDYILELEKKLSLLEEQVQDRETKLVSNEEQLNILKTHIRQLQEDFGDFENLNELKEMIHQQRAKLLEATRQNGELAEALQKKDLELEKHIVNATEQDRVIEQRDGIIKMLAEKEEEHSNIIKLLRNNLELRNQADIELNQQLSDKNSEVESLITNLETRKKQISQLEKIILTLEDQTRKIDAQRRKDQEKIKLLENKVADYESYNLERKRSIEAPVENIDSIMKILEEELGTSLNARPHQTPPYYSKKDYGRDPIKHSIQEKYELHEVNKRLSMNEGHERIPTKSKIDANAKKAYNEYKNDNLDRKKANTSIDTQKYVSVQAPGLNVYDVPIHDNFFSKENVPTRPKDLFLSRNLNFLAPFQYREDKKCKMYKFAGHRL